MPPVALGDTDPRRWEANSAAGADTVVVGAHWPRAGFANNPREHAALAFVVDKIVQQHPPAPPAFGMYDASAHQARVVVDESQQRIGVPDGRGRASPDLGGPPRLMEPRDLAKSDGHHDSGGQRRVWRGVNSSGGQQPGPPFDAGGSFEHLAQQHTHTRARHGDEAGPACFFMSTGGPGQPLQPPHPLLLVANNGVGPTPLRQHQQEQHHRSNFEQPSLMLADQQQQQQQQRPLGAALALGPDSNNRGRNMGGGAQHHGMGGAAAGGGSWQVQQHQHRSQQPQQHQPMRSSSPGNRLLGSTSRGSPTNNQQMSMQPPRRGSASPEHHSSMSMAARASLPHGASALPASAVPTVLERFPGFVRCVMDIAPEVVGWVIGRSGAHIKEMKHRSGCGMWVDQKDLKLYITGADMPRIHAAAALVGDLISKAPVNVNSAGVEDEVTSHMIECPPHLIGLLIGRGGSTIKRIKEESRANVVINQKMMKVIVSGIPQSVRLGVAMIEDVITFGRSAEHGVGLGGAAPPNFLDFPAGVAGIAEFMDDGAGGLDSFTLRTTGPAAQQQFVNAGDSGVRLGSSPLTLPGSGDSGIGFTGLGGAHYDGESRRQQQQQLRGSPASVLHQQGGGGKQHQRQQQQQQQRHHSASSVATGGGGGGRPAEMEMDMDMAGFHEKDMDWSVFSASSSMFNIGAGPDNGGDHLQQSSPGAGGSRRPSHESPQHQHPCGLPPPSSARLSASRDSSHDSNNNLPGLIDVNTQSHGSRSSSLGGGGGLVGHNSASGGSRTGSISSGGTPPLGGRSLSTGPWNIMGAPPMKYVDGGSGGAPPLRSGNSPGTGLSTAGVLLNMKWLSINSDDSNSGGRSVGQASRHRERPGTPVGNPVDLAEFLGDMGLGQYTQALKDNEIDLEAIQLMADSDFRDIGIPKGPRVKLLYALRTNRYPPKSGDLSTMKTFLTSLGLERYCKAFEDDEVDMGAVDVMEESDYAQLGVAKGPRLKMMNVLATSMGANANSGLAGSSFTSGASGGGSNAGSVSIPSPEPRLSPEKHASSSPLSPSQWPFSMSAAAATGGATSGIPAGAAGGGGPRLRQSSENVGVHSSVGSDADYGSSSARVGGDEAAEAVGHQQEGSRGGAAGGPHGTQPAATGGWVNGVGEVSTCEQSTLSPPADVWVSSALCNAEDALEGGDGSH